MRSSAASKAAIEKHLRDVRQIIGKRQDVCDFSALSLLISQRGATFFTDTYVTFNPSAEEIAEIGNSGRRGNQALRHHAARRARIPFELRFA